MKRCVDAIGNEVFIVPVIGAPFTTAAALRGTEIFIKELYTDPELVHTLLRVSTQSVKNLIDAYVKAGGVPVTVEPVATGSMISEKHFREFALPYLKEGVRPYPFTRHPRRPAHLRQDEEGHTVHGGKRGGYPEY